MARRLVLTRASDIPPKRDYYREHRQRARDMGLERNDRISEPDSCPRRLVGKRHRDGCWCASQLNDHGGRYHRVRDRVSVVLWEPYGCSPEELTRVFSAAATDGLAAYVHGSSPWNPGRTCAIEFTAHV